ncbi:hypothetical protein HRbin27_01971 [bacterium HR27]|nr:hypothetical protein HRbin27_01971 [bacterium HR27]
MIHRLLDRASVRRLQPSDDSRGVILTPLFDRPLDEQACHAVRFSTQRDRRDLVIGQDVVYAIGGQNHAIIAHETKLEDIDIDLRSITECTRDHVPVGTPTRFLLCHEPCFDLFRDERMVTRDPRRPSGSNQIGT